MSTGRVARVLVFGAACALGGVADLPAQATLQACKRRTLGPLTANVPSVEVRPRFLLNGQPFPGAAAGLASFTLWATAPSDLFDGPQLTLGYSHEPTAPVRVIPGVYDVYYSWLGGPLVPRNQLTRILRGVRIQRDRQLTIDVPMVTVSGVKQHNGAAFVADGSSAELRLRGVGRPGHVLLGGTLPSDFQVRLIPGTYSFEYTWGEGATLPRNRHAELRRMTLARSTANLVLNVPSVAQDFVFLHNGEAFPNSAYAYGNVVLRRNDREEVLAGSSHLPPATVLVIPGIYDAHWRHVTGTIVPRNSDARFRRGVLLNGSPRILDVPSLEVSGDIRVNGLAPPESVYESARLSLAAPDGPDRALLGDTPAGHYSARVVPGRYDIVYEHLAGSGNIMPSNPRATLARGWRVAAQPSRSIDIPAGTYEASFLLNGEAFPETAYDSGRIYLVPLKGGGDPVVLGFTYDGGVARRLLPGVYRSAYAREAGGTIVPTNSFTTFGPLVRVRQGEGPAALSDVLDVRAAGLSVSYEHNGVPLPEGGPENARLHLHRGDNYLQLLDSAQGTSERIAMEGTFDLFYEYRGGPDLPRNAFMRFGCWDLLR